MTDVIRFNSRSEGYRGALSTFYPHAIVYDGRVWPTAEHAYQAAKTDSEEMKELIKDAPSPSYAKRLGATMLLRMGIYDWNEQKRNIMKDIIREKLRHYELKSWLIHPSNAKKTIIHEAPWDPYWGNGPDGNGRNELGKIYMELREELLK